MYIGRHQYMYIHTYIIYMHAYIHMSVCMHIDYACTRRPSHYSSFAVAILSQNHWEIDIAESILASRKVIIEVFFQ